LYTAYFVENLKSPFFTVKRNDAGKVVLDVWYKTDSKLPVIAAADIGKWALVAFKDPENWIGECSAYIYLWYIDVPSGKDLKVTTEWITPREIAKLLSEEIGEPIELVEVDEARWQTLRVKEYEEVWLNMQTFYTAGPDYRDVELSNRLVPDAITVRSFIQKWGKSIVQ
jgi:hypothetical protein